MKTQKSQKNYDARSNSQSKSQFKKEKKNATKIRIKLGEDRQQTITDPECPPAVNIKITLTIREPIAIEGADGLMSDLKAHDKGKTTSKKQSLLYHIIKRVLEQTSAQEGSNTTTCRVSAKIMANKN